MRRPIFGVMLTLLFLSFMFSTVSIHPARASGTIYIRTDGSIDPPTAPIFTVDNVTYVLTGNITSDADGIVIERNSTIVDGAGYTLQGTGSGRGIDLFGRSNVTIKNTSMKNFWYGIELYESPNNNMSANSITDNSEAGIHLYSSSSNIISGNLFTNNGLFVEGSYGNVVEDNLVNGKPLVYLEAVSYRSVVEAGQVILVNCEHIQVENLNLSNTSVGIQLWKTNNTIISGNKITNNSESGIDLFSSSNTSMTGNKITNNAYGILLRASSNYNSISGNNITNNYDHGIELSYSSEYNSISGNNITNSRYGIDLFGSSSNSIVGNVFADDGLFVWGSYGSVVVDNSVNGKPLVYLEDISDAVAEDAGQVVLVNCYGIRVENLNLSSATVGVQLWNTTNTTITNNYITNNSDIGIWLGSSSNNNNVVGNTVTNNENDGIFLSNSFNNSVAGNSITNNYYGIYLWGASNNSISGNNITNNGWLGIYLYFCPNNSISGNNIANNFDGIYADGSSNDSISGNNITNNGGRGIILSGSSENNVNGNNITANKENGIELYESSNNTLTGNSLTNNEYNIGLYYSSNNKFWHNSLIGSTQQVYMYASGYRSIANVWDDGYPSGGNYWSDYWGTEFDAYGIGSEPYIIDANNTDRFPLKSPYVYGDLNRDSVVNIVDIAIVAKAFGCKPGDSNWNPVADMDLNEVINIVDVSKVAKQFGKEWKVIGS